ncbi:hypothetical protein OS493_003711 [Desmophyllum pertusum]|uniref:Uncharacterized protein n=1 Tax=Desmophyllum pertusum TaxID=174260 RepID=A0A9X0A601_9CNID|nr:hypothetical protein OS493_003711 [Desmophyllum pertusum]
MKTHFNAVFFMAAVFLIVLLPEGFSLDCHTCYSSLSWDDCLKSSRVINCSLFDPEAVCIKMIQAKRLISNNQQVVVFGKFCYAKGNCDTKSCEDSMRTDNKIRAARCYLECCSKDLCNNGKLSIPQVSEVSKAEIPFISCLCVMTLVVVSFILVND